MNTGLFSRGRHLRKFVLFFSFFFITTFAISFAETITYTDSGGTNPRSSPPYAGGYTVHTFTATGTTNFTIPLNVTSIDYLVVGGGGGGGVGTGGGGGAGGMLVGNGSTTFYAGQSYTVTVGNGGMGGDAAPNWYGTNGSSSVFGSVTALGGGGGGGNDGAEAGRNGGSGGGAGGPPGGSSPGSGTAGQGYSGGSYGSIQGGGGGGAGEAGSTDSVGYGGGGLQSSISGTATWYAGGGGGRNTGGSSGGTGGGGGEGQNGTSGTGGGGGGYHPTRGDGGSGIVIVRYLTPDPNLAVLATSTSVSYVTESSATFSSSLISIGGASVTSRGICYGTTRYPTNCVAEGGTATGDFSITLSNLATSTTYFYRSYATNSYGTSTSADGIFTTEGITNSLMFDSAQSQYLSRTFGTPTNNNKWTWSGWVKRGSLSTDSAIFGSFNTGGLATQFYFNSSDQLRFFQSDAGASTKIDYVTTQVFRDPSAWMHVMLVYDNTLATTDVDLYINGEQITAFTSSSNTAIQNGGYSWNKASLVHRIGVAPNTAGTLFGYFDGYMSETNFIDGQALAPDYFGRPDPNTGNWIPKAYQGTYGKNGFHLNFSSSTALGYDTAPIDSTHTATNTWTTNGSMSSTTNQVIDNPLNNFATLNPTDPSGTAAIANGSLQIQTAAKGRKSTFFVSSGKWVWEIHFSSTMSGVAGIGIADASTNMDTWTGGNYVLYRADGGKQVNGSYGGAYGASYTNGDVIRVEYNADASTIEFFKQTGGSGSFVSQGTLAVTAGTYSPTAAIGATSGIIIFNFGQFPFLSTPTTGFKALSTANLPTPTILKPNQHFDVTTRTGTAASYIKNGLAFKPDFIWNKGRNGVTAHYLQDIVRGFGASKSLSTNTSNAEGTDGGAPTLHSLNPTIDGYTLSAGDSNLNTNGTTYVDWLWKAGNATTTNTAGSITSTISTNSIAGFTAGTFTIPSSYSNATVGHGLGSIPSFIIFRPTNVTSTWYVWHKSLASNQYLGLNLTDSTVTNSNLFNGQATTTFTLGNSSWFGGVSYPAVFYAFTEAPGYSKFGTYTGNGSTDGPFVYTGFKPRYVMLKVTNAASNWVIIDTERRIYNVNGTELQANSGVAEIAPGANSDNYIDMLSNGFKIRGIRGDYNNSGSPIIYAAFAESVLIPTVPSLPTLSSLTATSTTETTAVLGATVDTIGGSNLTARGICYGTTPTPTNCTAGTGTSTGVFTVSITGLATSTNYYYRAYATNASGTAYTSDSTFYTEGPSASLMFDSASNQYLNRTPSVAGNQQKWTYSFWVKRSMLYAQNNIQFVLATAGSGAQGFIGFGQANNSDEISFGYSGYVRRYTSALFRDPSAWQHVVLKVDTTATAEADRAIFYVNGVQASMVTPTTISQNDTTQINQAVSTLIGNQTGQPYGRFDGYLSDVNFIDGQALTPSSFGENASSTGNWIPKSYTGTYGTNGFRLNFNNSNLLGADSSGNSNHWSLNGGITSANNQVIDTPLNNFATLNSVEYSGSGGVTYSKGNLSAGFGNNSFVKSSISIKSKTYFEVTITTNGASGEHVGVLNSSAKAGDNGQGNSNYWFYQNYTGNKLNGSSVAYGSTWTAGDVIGVAVDPTLGKIWWSKNGTWQGSGDPSGGTNAAFTNLPSEVWSGFSLTSSYNSNVHRYNFGQGGQSGLTYDASSGGYFKYTPPTGFKALSTANLPIPSILKPNQHFDVKLHTGNTSSNSITGVAFQPDLIWSKGRNVASGHRLVDSVRGGTKNLVSNLTAAEDTDVEPITFTTDGFSMNGSNHPNAAYNYVDWMWKAGNATTTNTSGTITSTVSANPTAGLSIVAYTGTGANGTVGHGLNSSPKMVIVRNRDMGGRQWTVYHEGMGGNQYWMALQDTFGRDTGTNNWNNTSPTTTVFSVSGELNPNESTKKIIAYVFAEVPGFSKFGSYTGNGSADGPFVYTGFKPRWIMIKRTDSANDWHIIDTARDLYNVNYNPLFPNLAQGESPDHAYDRDILSNGFKIRSDISYLNASGGTFIYAAFAESIMIPTIPETTTSTESGSANLEEVTVTPSNGEAIIDYTIPSNPAFDQVVILRSTQPIVDTPSNGASYNVNDVIGSATVACVDATIASSTFDYCTASSLSNNTTYYFKAYTKSGTIFTEATLDGSPSTPNVGASNITVSSYRLRNDDGNDTNASYLHSENTPATSSFISGDKIRIRFTITNHTTSLINKRYQIEYANSSNGCTSWTAVPSLGGHTNEHFRMDTSSFISDSASTTHSSGLSVPNGKVFKTGRFQAFNSLTRPIVLQNGEYTEIEYLLRSTGTALPGVSYCFRLTNRGDPSDFTYLATPQILTKSQIFRHNAGGGGGGGILKIEDVVIVATTTVTGGGADGSVTATSTISEPTATTTTQQSTTTPTRRRGGGGSVGSIQINTTLASNPYRGMVLGATVEPMCTNMKYTMAYGDRDRNTEGEVSQLQYYLQQKGYFNHVVTGNYLNVTREAVKQFQRDSKLPITGITEKITRDFMSNEGCINSN